ncbi:DUF3800 domain-containing protein [Martelella sp. FLE1502]
MGDEMSEGKQALLYFCDESSIRCSEHMAVGGLAITPTRASEVCNELREMNAMFGVTSEVMWKSAKRRRDNIYKFYIDYLYELIQSKKVHLHLRFQPFNDYDHKLSGNRHETDTVSKAFYMLLLHRAGRYYSRSCKIYIRPDNGNCTSYLPNMLTGLNNEISTRFDVQGPSIAEIKPVSSKKEHMLQLLDVTLGALACARNKRHESGELGDFKKELVAYVVNKYSIDVEHSHAMDDRIFNVWNVKPKIAVP